MKFKSKNQTILYYIRIKNFYFPLCLRPGLTDSGRTGRAGPDRVERTGMTEPMDWQTKEAE
jgi:hypothetical protein